MTDSLIEKLEARIGRSNIGPQYGSGYNAAIGDAIDIIRKHQTEPPIELVERVANAIENLMRNGVASDMRTPVDHSGYFMPSWFFKAAKAAIAAMGDASTRKDEAQAHKIEPSDSIGSHPDQLGDACNIGSPSEISVVEENVRAILDYEIRHDSTIDEMLFRLRPYIRTTEPVSVDLEKQLCALLHKAPDKTVWDNIAATLEFVRGNHVD